MYKNTACMMHMGNMTKVRHFFQEFCKKQILQDFVPVGQDMQAELKDKTNAEKVRLQLSTSFDFLCQFFINP